LSRFFGDQLTSLGENGEKVRVLYVTRKFPPSIGGMQRLSYHLDLELQKRVELTRISWGGSQIFLPLFFPIALIKSILVCLKRKDIVLLGDPIMSPIGFVLKTVFKCPTVVTVHGLDISYPFRPYQWIIPKAVEQCNSIVCISENTKHICLNHGISELKCQIIHPGVEIPGMVVRETSRKWLETRLKRSLSDVTVLLTVGRLVRRKGVDWLLKNVIPELSSRSDCVYIVVGTGPDKERIRQTIADSHLDKSVFLLGKISDDTLKLVYGGSDLFLMPTLQVQ